MDSGLALKNLPQMTWQYIDCWSWHGMQSLVKVGRMFEMREVVSGIIVFLAWKRQTSQFRFCGIRVTLVRHPGDWTGWEVIASYLWWIDSSSPVLLHEGWYYVFKLSRLPEMTQFLRYHKEYRAMFESHLQTILQSLGMTEARLQLGLVFWGSQCHTSQVARIFLAEPVLVARTKHNGRYDNESQG